MAYLPLLTLILLVSFSAADDAVFMSKLAASLSPAPSSWTGTAFCKWSGVTCNNGDQVTALNLNAQSLSGTLPSDLNSLSQLVILSLQGNHFSGELPSLENLSNLQEAYLNNNNFSSIAINAFAGLTSLQNLSLSSNTNLSPWKFPSELIDSSELVRLYASSCNLTGSIPEIFDSFPILIDLQLSYNSLTGSLPSTLGGSAIQTLWLNNNNQGGSGLTGSIDVIGEMPQLFQVWLHGNSFTGPIPDLSNCTGIFDLQLRDNQLTGVVPPSLTALPNLLNVTFQNNKLQGPCPEFKSNVKVELGTTNSFCTDKPGEACDSQVTTLLTVAGAFGYPLLLADSWQGNDACSPWPYISCDSSGNVTSVTLGKQHLNGSISPAFAELPYLRSLFLNDNNLTGTIPENLTTLTHLVTLDVSNNNISGHVPKFRTGVTVTDKGNKFIGTDINTGSGGSSGSNSTSSDSESNATSQKSSISAGLVAGLVIAVIVFLVVVLFVSYKCYVHRRHQKFGKVQNPEIGAEMVKTNGNGVSVVTTNGYTGVPTDLQSQSSGDHSEMPMFEGGSVVISIQVIRQVTNNFSDDNILGRGGFGVVYSGELHDGTKIAVKRMESSAMGTKGMKEFQAEIAVLTKVRHRHLVALLGYCINGNERLLVYEYMPQGTLGQHLFECQERATGRVTTKVDVYAFGVILMELITGRKTLDESMPEDRCHLVTWFRRILINKDNIRKAIDGVLDPDDETYESIMKVAELAGHCTAREAHQRPDMGHAVNVLGPLVEQWKPSCHQDEDSYGIDLHMSLPQALQRWQADEGTSAMFSDISFSQTQNSMPARVEYLHVQAVTETRIKPFLFASDRKLLLRI
ncbi:hypothetical protein V2J09_024033 [Rumex salicifolius]